MAEAKASNFVWL